MVGLKRIYRSLSTQIPGPPLVDCDYAFFPVCTESHWFLFVVDIKRMKVNLLDLLRDESDCNLRAVYSTEFYVMVTYTFKINKYIYSVLLLIVCKFCRKKLYRVCFISWMTSGIKKTISCKLGMLKSDRNKLVALIVACMSANTWTLYLMAYHCTRPFGIIQMISRSSGIALLGRFLKV